jgi:hypothetical protein
MMVLKLRGSKKPKRLTINSYTLAEISINTIEVAVELHKEVNIDL